MRRSGSARYSRGSKKEDAIQNQYEFLIQRMGGPPLFSQRRGN